MDDQIKIATTQAQENVSKLSGRLQALTEKFTTLQAGLKSVSNSWDFSVGGMVNYGQKMMENQRLAESLGRQLAASAGQLGSHIKQINSQFGNTPELKEAASAFITQYVEPIRQQHTQLYADFKATRARDLSEYKQTITAMGEYTAKMSGAGNVRSIAESNFQAFANSTKPTDQSNQYNNLGDAVAAAARTKVSEEINLANQRITIEEYGVKQIEDLRNQAHRNEINNFTTAIAAAGQARQEQVAGIQQEIALANQRMGVEEQGAEQLANITKQAEADRIAVMRHEMQMINDAKEARSRAIEDNANEQSRILKDELVERERNERYIIELAEKRAKVEQEQAERSAALARDVAAAGRGNAVSAYGNTLPVESTANGQIRQIEALKQLRTAALAYQGVLPNLVTLQQQIANNTVKVTEKNIGLVRAMQNLASSVPPVNKNLKAFDNAIKNTGVSLNLLERFLQFRLIAIGLFKLINELQTSTTEMFKFGTAVAQIQTISQDSPLTFNEWADSLRRLSTEFNIPLLDAAKGAYQALSNQIGSSTEVINFSTDAARFAKAAVTDQVTAVNLLSSVLKSFQLTAQETAAEAAKMYKAIVLGRFVAEDVGNNLGRTAELAHLLGLSTDELNASMSTLTRLGIPASEAQTQLAGVLNALIKPSKELHELYDKWGVSTGQAAISAFGFTGVLEKLVGVSDEGVESFAQLFHRIQGLKGGTALTQFFDQFKSDLHEIGNATEEYENAVKIVTEAPAQIVQKEITRFHNAIGAEVENIIELVAGVQKKINEAKVNHPGILDAGNVAEIATTFAATSAVLLVVNNLLTSAAAGSNTWLNSMKQGFQLGLLGPYETKLRKINAQLDEVREGVVSMSPAKLAALEGQAAILARGPIAIMAEASAKAAGTSGLKAGTIFARGFASAAKTGLTRAIPELLGRLAGAAGPLLLIADIGYTLKSIFDQSTANAIDAVTDRLRKLNELDVSQLQKELAKAHKEFDETFDAIGRATLGVIAAAQSNLNEQEKVIDEAFDRVGQALKSGYKSLTEDQRKGLERAIDLQVNAAQERFERAVTRKEVRGKRNEAAGHRQLADKFFEQAATFGSAGDKETALKFLDKAKEELDKTAQLLGRRANFEKEYQQILQEQLRLEGGITAEGESQLDYQERLARAGENANQTDAVAIEQLKIKEKLIDAQLKAFDDLTKNPKATKSGLDSSAQSLLEAANEIGVLRDSITVFDPETTDAQINSIEEIINKKLDYAKQELDLARLVTEQTKLQESLKKASADRERIKLERREQGKVISEELGTSLGELGKKRSGVLSQLSVTGSKGAAIALDLQEANKQGITIEQLTAKGQSQSRVVAESESALENLTGVGREKFITGISNAIASGDLGSLKSLVGDFTQEFAKANNSIVDLSTGNRGESLAKNALGDEGYNELLRLNNEVVTLLQDQTNAAAYSKIQDPIAAAREAKNLNAQAKEFYDQQADLNKADAAAAEADAFKLKYEGIQDKAAALQAIQDMADGLTPSSESIGGLDNTGRTIVDNYANNVAAQEYLEANKIKDLDQRKAAIKEIQDYYFPDNNASTNNGSYDAIGNAQNANALSDYTATNPLPVEVQGYDDYQSQSYAPAQLPNNGNQNYSNNRVVNSNLTVNEAPGTSMSYAQRAALKQQLNNDARHGG